MQKLNLSSFLSTSLHPCKISMQSQNSGQLKQSCSRIQSKPFVWPNLFQVSFSMSFWIKSREVVQVILDKCSTVRPLLIFSRYSGEKSSQPKGADPVKSSQTKTPKLQQSNSYEQPFSSQTSGGIEWVVPQTVNVLLWVTCFALPKSIIVIFPLELIMKFDALISLQMYPSLWNSFIIKPTCVTIKRVMSWLRGPDICKSLCKGKPQTNSSNIYKFYSSWKVSMMWLMPEDLFLVK